VLPQNKLDFSELNPESSDFHLMIDAS